jgi:hypothetical protein
MRLLAPLTLALLTGCTSFSPRFPTDAGAMQGTVLLVNERASYTQLTPDYAVTNDHAAHLVMGGVTRSDRYDLAYFKHRGSPPVWSDAVLGEPVTLAGNPISGWDYVASVGFGIPPLWPDRETEASQVIALVQWGCPCPGKGQTPFAAVFFRGPDRPGYSGGPVVNADREVVGVMSGVVTGRPAHEYHYGVGDGIAIPTALVWSEFHRLVQPEVASK